MTTFALDVKWNIVNITDLQPADKQNFRWRIKVKCTNCPEEEAEWHDLCLSEEYEIPGTNRTAHYVRKCKLCQRVNTIKIIPDSFRAYSIDRNGQFQSILKIVCDGVEPCDFQPGSGWKGFGPVWNEWDKRTEFKDIDLTEKECSDYDENTQEVVEIYSFEHRFVRAKKKK